MNGSRFEKSNHFNELFNYNERRNFNQRNTKTKKCLSFSFPEYIYKDVGGETRAAAGLLTKHTTNKTGGTNQKQSWISSRQSLASIES